jgi:beta-glucosidase
VTEAKAVSVMPAYNRTNGEPCAASETLLVRILRGEWGFTGYVVSDCGAIGDIYRHHKTVETREAAAALAVKTGCDLNCGDTYCGLTDAVLTGLLKEEDLDIALLRLFEARFRLGMFDPPESVPYAQIPFEVNDCAEHRELAHQAALESIVLLKNEGGLLPIRPDVKSIAVIGPNADEVEVLLGNYNGIPSQAVTPLEGIRNRAGSDIAVRYAKGCELVGGGQGGFAEALDAARASDLVVMALGLSPRLEGEEGESNFNPGGDRIDIALPEIQESLLRSVHSVGKPVVLVLLGGSAIAVEWAKANVPAILMTWYGGEEAGTALAEVLFGDKNPAGRLPVTFYKSLEQLPPFEEYAMKGRTYRFMDEEPLYPFGYGLSYAAFEYGDLRIEPERISAGRSAMIHATVKNVGEREGDEVAQLYISDVEASVPVPIRQLRGFRRVSLQPGEAAEVSFVLDSDQLVCYSDDGEAMLEPGAFRIAVGGGRTGGVEGELVVE